MGPAELVPAESVPIIVKLSNMGPAELVPAKLVKVLQFSGAVPQLEELEIQVGTKIGRKHSRPVYRNRRGAAKDNNNCQPRAHVNHCINL